VVQNPEVALVSAYGLRDVETGLKATTETQFLICSITKSFTATGLALLMVRISAFVGRATPSRSTPPREGGAARFGGTATPIRLSPEDRTKTNNIYDRRERAETV
jgi:hypothetical protein